MMEWCSYVHSLIMLSFIFQPIHKSQKAKLLRKGGQLGNLLILRVEYIATISAIINDCGTGQIFLTHLNLDTKMSSTISMKRLGQIFWHI